MFLSHNNSAETVFFSQFQPSFRPVNGAMRHIVVFLDEGNIVGSFFLDNLPFDLLSIFQWRVSPRFVLALVVLSVVVH